MSRLDYVIDEHLEYLDDLRVSCETNMYGATPYLMREFPELEEKIASEIVSYWMKTFGKDNRQQSNRRVPFFDN